MNLPKRQLGNTDLFVSTLGLGTVKIGRNTDIKYPENFNIPEDKDVINLLAQAKDFGINLIDTAPAYGTSEVRLGNLLQGQRHEWVIVGKAGEDYENKQSTYNFTRKHILESIKRSLKNLKTDYIDALLIHSDGNDMDIINNFDVFNTLDDAKQQGLIRYSGMSTKTVDGGILALQHSDMAMVMYNPIETAELPVIEKAHEWNKGILVKKAFASGHLQKFKEEDPVARALEFILNTQGVSSVILGTINPAHLHQNVQAAVAL